MPSIASICLRSITQKGKDLRGEGCTPFEMTRKFVFSENMVNGSLAYAAFACCTFLKKVRETLSKFSQVRLTRALS